MLAHNAHVALECAFAPELAISITSLRKLLDAELRVSAGGRAGHNETRASARHLTLCVQLCLVPFPFLLWLGETK